MDNIYIVTAHTGYNYGTYLQAYAMKKFLQKYGDKAEIIWQKSWGPKGRDFRLRKAGVVAARAIFHFKNSSGAKQGYQKSFAVEPDEESKKLFDQFSREYLEIKEYSYWNLKKIARKKDTRAVVCGSDQIWNASTLYPDPLYYLRFVPQEKRIAYAPSFGRSEVPEYNYKKISAYVKEIPYLSVREKAGAEIIQKMTGREVPVLPDPTLLVDWGQWKAKEKENVMLLYFLDQPTETTVKEISQLQQALHLKVKVLLHGYENYKKLNNIEMIQAGPKEFVEEISKAKFVCTDSYHATVFSILFETPFYTYERNYGKVESQGSRLETLLRHYALEDRYRKEAAGAELFPSELDRDWIKEIREKDRSNANQYICQALGSICEENEGEEIIDS